jgi:nitrite reductase/ring-hydroxylating ferredoxin subunit
MGAMHEILLFEKGQDFAQLIPPGEARLVRALGQDICVVNFRGKLHAFANDCPHAGYPLHRGKVNSFGEMVCTQHGYIFHLTTGEEAGRSCPSLRLFDIVEREGAVYLKL